MIFRTVLLFIALVFIIQPARAAEPVGNIIEIEGAATRIPTGSAAASPLNINDTIYLNDTIQTFGHSRILVMLEDDTEITLGENSSRTVDEYIYDPENAAKASGKFSVMKGSFLFVSGLISKNPAPDVKVKTSYGTIGLRGTTVWGGEMDGEYGVLVQDGEVEVSNNAGRMIVQRGKGTFMKAGEAPRLPKIWPAAKSQRAVGMIALKRQDVIRSRIAARKVANAAARKKNIQSPGGIERNIERQMTPLLMPEEQPINGDELSPKQRIDNLKRKKEILEMKKERMNAVKPPDNNR